MPVDRQQLRRDLMRLVSAQHGFFTAGQALTIGYSYQAQKFHADRGNWQRIDRALFRMADWAISEEDGLVRWTVWSGGVAVVSHASALDVHGLGDANPARLTMTVPADFTRTDDAVLLYRDDLAASDVEERNGYRVTTPRRALAECAASGLAQETLDSSVDDALRRGLITPRVLRDAAAELGPRAELGVERALSSVRQNE